MNGDKIGDRSQVVAQMKERCGPLRLTLENHIAINIDSVSVH